MQTLFVECCRDGFAFRGENMRPTAFESLSEELGAMLQATSHSPVSRVSALVDGALLLDLPPHTRRDWASLPHQSLLVGASEDVAAVGPLLYSIPRGRFDKLATTLCDPTSGRVAGSFIVSDQEGQDLAQRLSALVDVQLDDGSNMIMRFFDPRVLPFWLDRLAPTYRRYLADAIVEWIFIVHDFKLQKMRFDRLAPTAPLLQLPMNLPLDVEDALMDDCFPFTMIERLRAEDPSALERVPVAQRYQFFRTQIERARGHGISGQGGLEAYCGTAIEFGAAFDEDPGVRSALAGIRQGQTFDEALAGLTDADWQRVRGQP